MIDLTTPIIPYEGTGIFKLDSTYDEVKALLKSHDIVYDEEVRQANKIDPSWIIIGIDNNGIKFEAIQLFFAKNRLFKIVLEDDFKGSLPNGINLDTTIDDAQKIDTTLKFDDWEEVFASDNGYWIEDNLNTKKLLSISIFIPAFERDDFFEYKW